MKLPYEGLWQSGIVRRELLDHTGRVMTATVNQRGHIVLRKSAREKWDFRRGDLLVVVSDEAGRIVLQKRHAPQPHRRHHRSYLTPPPLTSAALKRIYARPDPDWDTVEAEAVAVGRRALAGRRLEEL